ncbi:MAG: hypothetical protein HYT71_00205 [Candidatus Aenigmarchaeota archaeon]|nr:hypothetical protein [Candidatus Aenigmarchaeota archaeon]
MGKNFFIGIASFAIIFSFLFTHFKPDLVFSDTTVTGGDTGSHNYLFYYMKNSLLTNLKLTGWSPDWYLGFPAFQFYFPIPYALGSILSNFTHINIAVKIITLLGTFLLPLAAYFAMKAMDFEEPAPCIAAFLSLIFLFIESNSVWGGNIPSTLSGEFAYSISFALTFLFIPSMYGSVSRGKYEVKNSILFSLIVLTHIYTAIFSAAASFLILICNNKTKMRDKFLVLTKTYFVSALLASFWALPLLNDIHFKTDFGYRWTIESMSTIFPAIYLPIIIFSILGIKNGAAKKDARVLFLIHIMLLAAILYLASQLIGLVDVRFLPFMQFAGVLLGAYGLSQLVKNIKPKIAAVLIIGLLTILWVNNNISYIDGWIDWNYSGSESKTSWAQFSEINGFLKNLPYGRMFHEYSPSHSKFGTPRAFELLPMFTGKPTIEGLTIESGLLAPFTFYLQSELSESPTCPIPGLKCSYFDPINGTEHLELFNVKYVIATSNKLKNSLDNMTQYEKLKSFDDISVYELNDGRYASVPKYEPVAVITDDWRNVSMSWFKDKYMLDVPLVFIKEKDDRFSQIIYDYEPEKIKKVSMSDCPLNETFMNESIKITTSCIGKPVLVKIPYFPDWSVVGADKIYLTSPGFMMVFPDQTTVELKYGSTSNVVGNALTMSGLVFVGIYLFSTVFRKEFQQYGSGKHVKKHKRNI